MLMKVVIFTEIWIWPTLLQSWNQTDELARFKNDIKWDEANNKLGKKIIINNIKGQETRDKYFSFSWTFETGYWQSSQTLNEAS